MDNNQTVKYKLKKTIYFEKAKPGENIINTDGMSIEYLVQPEILNNLILNEFNNKIEIIQQENFSFWFNKNKKSFLKYLEKEISFTNISIIYKTKKLCKI